jgi:formate--tetrahydrofolate ligase|tara:strand:- start:53 stop:328 length:276 start_codon:yes stop_codon:yes gene_type:complete
VALVSRIAIEGGAYDAVEASHFAHGGAGAAALGRAVMAACADPAANSTRSFKHLYDVASQGIKEKIEAIVKGAYGGDGASYSEAAEARIAQ